MPSKVMINILALVALVGLVTFGAVSILDFQEAILKEKPVMVSVDKVLVENNELREAPVKLQARLKELRQENKKIEDAVDLNKRTLNDSIEVLVDLENQKSLVETSIKTLKIKKTELENTLVELAEQAKEQKKLQEVKDIKEKESIDNRNKLLSELTILEEKNGNLEKKIVSIKNDKKKALLDLNTKVTNLENDSVNFKKKALINEELLRQRIVEMTKRIQILAMENKDNLDELVSQKELNVKTLQSQNDLERELASKSNREIENLNSMRSNLAQLNGLRVIFSGNMIYDDSKSQIVFRADNSIGIPIFQDDFTGSIAGQCGLPIDKEIKNRCSATIIAEFVVENDELFLRGKEIVEIVRK